MIKFNGEINFDEKEHKYSTKDGKPLISVSQLIHLYCQPFDPDGSIIAKCAAKEGISVSELRIRWDQERDKASDKGHNFHASVEHYIKTGKIKNNEFKEIVKEFSGFEFAGKLHSETIIFKEDDGIAGTVDLIEELPNGEIAILDFKTNKSLRKFAFGKKTMLPPLDSVPDSIFHHYVVQLSLYAYMMDCRGYWINSLGILYINPKTGKIEHHETPYLRKEVISMLEHYKQNHLAKT